jgi:hypothetical protein
MHVETVVRHHANMRRVQRGPSKIARQTGHAREERASECNGNGIAALNETHRHRVMGDRHNAHDRSNEKLVGGGERRETKLVTAIQLPYPSNVRASSLSKDRNENGPSNR